MDMLTVVLVLGLGFLAYKVFEGRNQSRADSQNTGGFLGSGVNVPLPDFARRITRPQFLPQNQRPTTGDLARDAVAYAGVGLAAVQALPGVIKGFDSLFSSTPGNAPTPGPDPAAGIDAYTITASEKAGAVPYDPNAWTQSAVPYSAPEPAPISIPYDPGPVLPGPTATPYDPYATLPPPTDAPTFVPISELPASAFEPGTAPSSAPDPSDIMTGGGLL